ncbi:hypothetical protein PpBr36_00726 [Pyricularia pennisetigena]|uniref:hypothetical protein n=1 Tax=Pyricularia pennisetigena TaxID=1578925 RepID=UPI0011533F77|nr:hypothetical protein PpBr36_00726 [Pyricularia pennisetigena]TLS27939.1 hypothetical protein PpBr36_00726 [Pyricularia pennisetigena]
MCKGRAYVGPTQGKEWCQQGFWDPELSTGGLQKIRTMILTPPELSLEWCEPCGPVHGLFQCRHTLELAYLAA